MCDLCRQDPCSCRCPNYSDEDDPVCSVCGELIEEYFADIDGVLYCEECLGEMTHAELLNLCGYRLERVGEGT